jgi:hypothetical protein
MPVAGLKRHYGRRVKSHAAAYRFREVRDITILPDVSQVQSGNASFSIRCDIPTLAGNGGTVIGRWGGFGGGQPFYASNWDCQDAFVNYSHGVVTSANLSAEIFPLQTPAFDLAVAADQQLSEIYNAEVRK